MKYHNKSMTILSSKVVMNITRGSPSRNSRERLPRLRPPPSSYDEDGVSFIWTDGQCVGYRLHPKLYRGRPPKSEGRHLSRPRNFGRKVRKKLEKNVLEDLPQEAPRLRVTRASASEFITEQKFSEKNQSSFAAKEVEFNKYVLRACQKRVYNRELLDYCPATLGGVRVWTPDLGKKVFLQGQLRCGVSAPEFKNTNVPTIVDEWVLLNNLTERLWLTYPVENYQGGMRGLASVNFPAIKRGQDSDKFFRQRLAKWQLTIAKVPDERWAAFCHLFASNMYDNALRTLRPVHTTTDPKW